MIVLDASCVLELILNTSAGRRVADRIRPPEESLHAPHLLDLEVVQVLRRYLRAGVLEPARASECLKDLADLDLDRYPHAPLVARIWALRENLTAYDAAYVALAAVLDAPLLTMDARLAGAPHHARVELLQRT